MTDYVEPADVDQEWATQDWASQTRRVLTRDLLVRAAHASRGEARSLEFRALHLNLPLVGEVSARLRISEEQRARVEHAALEALHEAVRSYDPYGEADFSEHATPYLERRMRTQLERPYLSRRTPRSYGVGSRQRHPVRLAVHRLALVIAGSRA